MKLRLITNDSEGGQRNRASKEGQEGMFRKIGRVSRRENSKASNDAG